MQLLLSFDILVIFGLCTDFFLNLEKESLNIVKCKKLLISGWGACGATSQDIWWLWCRAMWKAIMESRGKSVHYCDSHIKKHNTQKWMILT